MFAKAVLFAALALLVWGAAARPLGAHREKVVYGVKPYDTLWTIASAHYAGDVRDGVWRIERANHLESATIRPGQRLVLP
jgi:nucleoid-associated protein YgaU